MNRVISNEKSSFLLMLKDDKNTYNNANTKLKNSLNYYVNMASLQLNTYTNLDFFVTDVFAPLPKKADFEKVEFVNQHKIQYLLFTYPKFKSLYPTQKLFSMLLSRIDDLQSLKILFKKCFIFYNEFKKNKLIIDSLTFESINKLEVNKFPIVSEFLYYDNSIRKKNEGESKTLSNNKYDEINKYIIEKVKVDFTEPQLGDSYIKPDEININEAFCDKIISIVNEPDPIERNKIFKDLKVEHINYKGNMPILNSEITFNMLLALLNVLKFSNSDANFLLDIICNKFSLPDINNYLVLKSYTSEDLLKILNSALNKSFVSLEEIKKYVNEEANNVSDIKEIKNLFNILPQINKGRNKSPIGLYFGSLYNKICNHITDGIDSIIQFVDETKEAVMGQTTKGSLSTFQ